MGLKQNEEYFEKMICLMKSYLAVSRSNFSDEDFSPVGGVESADRPSCSKRVERDERNLFKPLSLDQSAANESRSFTGQAFLRKFVLHSQSPSTSQNGKLPNSNF